MSNTSFSEVILLVQKSNEPKQHFFGKPKMTFHCLKALLGYLNYEKCSSTKDEYGAKIHTILDTTLLDDLKPEQVKGMIQHLAPNASVEFLPILQKES